MIDYENIIDIDEFYRLLHEETDTKNVNPRVNIVNIYRKITP